MLQASANQRQKLMYTETRIALLIDRVMTEIRVIMPVPTPNGKWRVWGVSTR